MMMTTMMLTITTYMDARLKVAVERYGNKWVKVTADIGGDVTISVFYSYSHASIINRQHT